MSLDFGDKISENNSQENRGKTKKLEREREKRGRD